MAQHKTAANVLMALLLVAGATLALRIKQEVFPEFDLDRVLINVGYPGASPAEVEQGVILAIEEAVRGIDGIKEVRSTASEGAGVVTVDLLLGTDPDRGLNDIKAAVDRITSFPEDIERPVVALATNRQRVLSLIVHGDKTERELRQLAERTRDELLADPRITFAELASVRPYEISIDVPQESLRRYGLTIESIANRIRAASVELPGGGVRTRGGEVLVRTTERRLTGSEFESIVLLSQPDGTEIRVKDVARVVDGFQETDQESFFNGRRAALVDVFRVGEQTPLEVSAAVKEYIDANEARLPSGAAFEVWSDRSEIYEQRIDLLMRNARIGLVLVLLILGLFLELRLAFWVTLGIPISFIGSFLFLPMLGVSLNMISLFAFIVTLGMVVDDAIVVGEAVYKRRQEGNGAMAAAIGGVREVAVPVTFSIVTTCVAFSPLLIVPGIMGKFFRVIPLVVIVVLLMSLIESLLILPAHLAHRSKVLNLLTRMVFIHNVYRFVHPFQQRFSRVVESWISRVYVPWVSRAVRYRYATAGICLAMFIATMGIIAGERLRFTFFPKIEGDVVTAQLELPFGTSVEETKRAWARMEESLYETLGDDRDAVVRGVFAEVGRMGNFGAARASPAQNGSHLAQVRVYLVPIDEREFSAAQLAERWRETIGEVAGAETLSFLYSTGPAGATPIDFELSHPDLLVLERTGQRLATALSEYSGVKDVDDGFRDGKPQLDFRLTSEGRSLGLTELSLARQVRGAFFGSEAVRQQRGREEVRVYVRRPLDERDSLYAIEQFMLRAPNGGEIPLGEAADVHRGRSYTNISRVDGRRVINVTADVAPGTNANQIVASITENVIPEIEADVPALRVRGAGEQQEQSDALGALGAGAIVAIVAIVGLLIIVFRSWTQWFVVMSAIPFGVVGAALGHLAMRYDLSIISAMGIVALSGVVVNDSLILVVAANDYRKEMPLHDAIVAAGARRFRPILLTSLTTFFGLAPMIAESSMQARFLIPMAISLGFGVLFSTFIILLLVPALYLVVEDVSGLLWSVAGRIYGPMDSDDGTSEEAAPAGK